MPRHQDLARRVSEYVAALEDRPAERRLVIVGVICGAVMLWLALAWAEPLLLLAMLLPGSVLVWGIREQRRRGEKHEQTDDIMY